MKYGKSRPWTNWEAILLRMYERDVMIFEKLRGQPRYLCDRAIVSYRSFTALESRYLVTRMANDGRGKVTWSLTEKGREAGKALQ